MVELVNFKQEFLLHVKITDYYSYIMCKIIARLVYINIYLKTIACLTSSFLLFYPSFHFNTFFFIQICFSKQSQI